MNITLIQLVRLYSCAYLDDLISLLDMSGHQVYYGPIRLIPDKYFDCRIARFNGLCDNIREYNYTDSVVGKVSTYLYKVKLVVTLC